MTTVIQYLVEGIGLGALYALFAISVALIFGVANIINFAQGEVIAVSAYVLLAVVTGWWPLLILLPVVAGVVVALGMERLAFRWVRGADPTTLLVAGFAVSIFLQSVLLALEGARAKTVDFAPGLNRVIDVGGVRVTGLVLVTIAVAALLFLGLNLILRRTPIGVQLRAAAADLRMAKLLGVRTDVVVGTAFALSGVLASVAAILLVARTGRLSPDMGVQPLVIAFVATVVGGLGSIYGAALGGLALGLLTVVLQNVLPAEMVPYRDAVVYMLVILTLLVRPQGLIATSNLKERV